MPVAFVIAVFEQGRFVGYWDDEEEDYGDDESDCTWHSTRESAADSLGEIPRKHDARIYCLAPSPDPVPRTEPPISNRLPEFLKADAST